MSGHSKWKTIQHKKGAADAKRGKVFSRLSKELLITARQGGGNPDNNPSLRTLISKARAANMPVDNIDRAIKKGTGELEGASLDEVVYEGYAGGGVGLVVVALTDNKNRAASEIRHIFSKHGTSFAGQGSVTRGFKRKGQIFVSAESVDEEQLMDTVLEAGAEDMKQDDDQFEILTPPDMFNAVMEALEKSEIATTEGEVSLVPDLYVPVTEEGVAKSVLKFVADLEDNEDVQSVYTNMDMNEELLKQMEAQE